MRLLILLNIVSINDIDPMLSVLPAINYWYNLKWIDHYFHLLI